jgi:hypothetical protein
LPPANGTIAQNFKYYDGETWRLDLAIVLEFIHDERDRICTQAARRDALSLARTRLNTAVRDGWEVDNDPILYAESSISAEQIQSGRPSYISGILIAAAGRPVPVSLNNTRSSKTLTCRSFAANELEMLKFVVHLS